MGTGNALRATETFTLIQLEEERQKLKKKELLKSMLTDSEFSIKGQCAINLMSMKSRKQTLKTGVYQIFCLGIKRNDENTDCKKC